MELKKATVQNFRSASNPYAAGWTAALICYPPFLLMGSGGPIDYHQNTGDWAFWTDGHLVLQALIGTVLVILTCFYAWGTVAFGLRFSNLTHRGIVTNGPFRFTRHPAYFSKNLFWWLFSMPFLATSDSLVDVVRNCALLAATNAVYYWRARTEERHLLADPTYRAYYEWSEQHALVPRLFNRLRGKRPPPDACQI